MWLFVWDVPSYYSLRVVSETCGSDFFTFAKFYLLTSKWPVAKLHLLAAQRERPSRSAFLLFRSGFTFEKSRTYWVLDILGMPFRMPFTILSLVLVFLVFLVCFHSIETPTLNWRTSTPKWAQFSSSGRR